MSTRTGVAVLALGLLVGGPVWACDDTGGGEVGAGHSAVLADALERLRLEQRAQMQRLARTALAQLRSEAATALAQGAATSASGAVKTGP